MRERTIYLLDPQKLSPETIAVTFAKTSRSPETFSQIAAELTDEKSSQFNEKWVVGYGHSSVAEHAVLHLAVENISRLAIETLESNRLASYTEKSTRYQTWEEDAFFIPEELKENTLQDVYRQACQTLFSTYQTCLQSVSAHLESTIPQVESETIAQRERRLRSHAVDACRFLLPAASLANVGVTINARALEHAIGKLLTYPLCEVREVGEEIKSAAMKSVPTLLKYADELPYLRDVCADFSALPLPNDLVPRDWCTLVHYDRDGLDRILAASIYREQNIDYTQCQDWLQAAPRQKKDELLYCLLGDLDPHTIPARELENLTFTFDVLMDQGAYFEVKRHRMMTQTPQHLTARLGYAIPRLIVDAGMLDPYNRAMEAARQVYEVIAVKNPALASYVVPNGFNRRVLLTLNLRSAIHFIQLRSAANAHFSVRRVAQCMSEQIVSVLPGLTSYLGRYEAETSQSIESDHFWQTM